MAIKNVKKKDHEKLSDSNIERVISLLEQEKPITKKQACEILNISYNTTRLTNIVEGYKAKKENFEKQKNLRKGKPASKEEIADIIKMYLDGENISEIANTLYRSSSFVKGVLDRIGVPQKIVEKDRYITAILPDQCVAEEFNIGQKAWSAKYHGPCEVIREVEPRDFYLDKYGCKMYKVWVIEYLDEPIDGFPNVTQGGFFASALACDLGSLEHLKEYGVNI
jgi:transposase